MWSGWSWDALLMTWMDVRHNISGEDACILRPLCIWIKFWMEVRHNLDGGESQIKLRRWMKGDGTWIEVGRESWDLYRGETSHRRRWKWDVNPGTLIQVKWYLDGGGTKASCPGWAEMGLGWSWDAILWTLIRTWTETRCDPNDDVTRISAPGWRWGMYWMEVRHKFRNLEGVGWDQDAGELQSWRTDRRGDMTEMEVRCKSWDLDANEVEPRCRWDANLAIWMGVRWGLDGGETQTLGPGWDEMGPGWNWDAFCGM